MCVQCSEGEVWEFSVCVCKLFITLEMQTTAKAKEPPCYVGHFLSHAASVQEQREKESLK